MADLTGMLMAASGSGGGESDPYFDQTILLLHGDGTNGAQNNTFLDSSTNNFTITRNGNTTQGTFSPFSGPNGYWSNFFDGASDYLTTPVSANLALGGSDFCIEWWEYRTSIADFEAVMGGNTSYVAIYDPIIAWPSGSDVLCFLSSNNSAWDILNGFDIGTATANQWIHRALTRDGNTFRGFENGVLINTTTAAGSVYMSANSWRIGQAQAQAANTFPGYISNLRMVIGSPVYTASFTPSTSPLTAISNTQLLTCQSNRFVDNSSNGFAITPTGNVSVQPFSPFAPSAAYSASVNSGGSYHDGVDDFVSVPSGTSSFAFGTGDFTVEFWLYANSSSPNHGLVAPDITGTYWSSIIAANLIYWQSANGSTNLFSASYLGYYNQWTHVAFVRNSGTVKLYLNGVEKASAANTTNYTLTGASYRVGCDFDNAAYLTGYMSSVRIVKGTAVYTSAFTPPTAPLTAVSGTELLLNFTNAGIYNNALSGGVNLETVGNAQVDTSVVKYGTGSMKFDGTGDWLIAPHSPNQTMGGGSFTFEAWVYVTTKNNSIFVSKGSSLAWEYFFGYDASFFRLFYNGSSNIILTDNITLNTWHFVSFVRDASAGTITAYVDGSSVGSASYTGTYTSTQNLAIGAAPTISGYVMKGYIDDVRITKGVARDGTVVPTAAFLDQ